MDLNTTNGAIGETRMTDKVTIPDDESGSGNEVVTSKSRFIARAKNAGHSAWRELTLDSKASYASRAYEWIGSLLVGSPSELGIADAKDFYRDQEDRDFPKGELADDSYEQRKQILIEDFRQDLRFGVSKLVVPIGILLCSAILLLGQMTIGASKKAQDIGSPASWFSSDKKEASAAEDDFSSTKSVELKRLLEQAKDKGRTTVGSLTPREKKALAEYKQRPNSGYETYPIIDQE